MTPSLRSLNAYILAGGRSRRMGRQKALIKWKGQSCLRRIVEAIRPCVHETVVIRKDRISSCGPLGGIYTALCECRQEWAWFFPCDMPGLNSEILYWWKEQAERTLSQTSESRRIGLICTVEARSAQESTDPAGFPLLIHRSLQSNLEKQLQKGEYSLQKLVQSVTHARVILPVEVEIHFRNINTPEDWHVFLTQNNSQQYQVRQKLDRVTNIESAK